MKRPQLYFSAAIGPMAAALLCAPAWALTGTQVGASGKTYASAGVICSMHPVNGMAPMVHSGLYNPGATASGTVSLNGSTVGSVTFAAPDMSVWLANGPNAVVAAISKQTSDKYAFDATPTFPGQPNVCIPYTGGNTISGDLEYAASRKSYATIPTGCALNPASGRPQPFVNLFDNGSYLLNVSINGAPLTQLSTTRKSTPVFLAPGKNVISAANGSLSVDYYMREGGTGTCTLP